MIRTFFFLEGVGVHTDHGCKSKAMQQTSRAGQALAHACMRGMGGQSTAMSLACHTTHTYVPDVVDCRVVVFLSKSGSVCWLTTKLHAGCNHACMPLFLSLFLRAIVARSGAVRASNRTVNASMHACLESWGKKRSGGKAAAAACRVSTQHSQRQLAIVSEFR